MFLVSRYLVRAAVLGFLATLAARCAPLTPFEQVRAGLPAEQFARLGEQYVHFERSGEGPPVVLIHGFGGSTFSFRKVAPDLARDFDVIAIDLSGFGYTQRPREAEAYSLAAQRALVLRLMDHLGVERAHLVGHSYGAGLALLMAQEDAARVRTVTLVDGGAPVSAPGSTALLTILRPLILPFAGLFVTEANVRGALESAVFDDTSVDREMLDGYLTRLRVEGLTWAFRGFTKQPAVTVPRIRPASIDRPVLILWGVHDTFIPISVGDALAEELPDVRMIRFGSSGHLPLEEQPTESVEAIRAFLLEHADVPRGG